MSEGQQLPYPSKIAMTQTRWSEPALLDAQSIMITWQGIERIAAN